MSSLDTPASSPPAYCADCEAVDLDLEKCHKCAENHCPNCISIHATGCLKGVWLEDLEARTHLIDYPEYVAGLPDWKMEVGEKDPTIRQCACCRDKISWIAITYVKTCRRGLVGLCDSCYAAIGEHDEFCNVDKCEYSELYTYRKRVEEAITTTSFFNDKQKLAAFQQTWTRCQRLRARARASVSFRIKVKQINSRTRANSTVEDDQDIVLHPAELRTSIAIANQTLTKQMMAIKMASTILTPITLPSA